MSKWPLLVAALSAFGVACGGAPSPVHVFGTRTGTTPMVVVNERVAVDARPVLASEYMTCVEHGGCTPATTEWWPAAEDGDVALSSRGCPLVELGDEPRSMACVSQVMAREYCAWAYKRLPAISELATFSRGERPVAEWTLERAEPGRNLPPPASRLREIWLHRVLARDQACNDCRFTELGFRCARDLDRAQ